MTDLDLYIRKTAQGYKYKKEEKEEWMIHSLYHTILYYEVPKYIQELDPKVLKYKMVLEKTKAHERNCLKYKVHLLTTAPCYLLMPLLNVGPVAMVPAIGVAKLMSKATALFMGKSVASAKVLIISKLFFIPRLRPRQWQALSRRNSLCTSNIEGHPQGAVVVVAGSLSTRRRRRLRNRLGCLIFIARHL